MTHPPTPNAAALNAERERIVQRLSEAFAADEVALDELESRLSQVWRADSLDALRQLVADLPAPSAAAPAHAAGRAAVLHAEEGPAKQTMLGIGGLVRRGRWRVPRSLRVVAILGVSRIDLREAQLTAPITEITAVAIAGRVEVIVPAGVLLESDGDVVHGRDDQHGTPSPSAPVVRVHGFTLMGGVVAKFS